MHSFKKALSVSLAFVLTVTLFSSFLIEAYHIGKPLSFQDSDVRDSMQGSIEVLSCGASHALRGIVPGVIDEKMDTVSYNLSYSLMTMRGRYQMLKKEISRNPVNTLILEVSQNTMSRDRKDEGPEGDLNVFGALGSRKERFDYLREAFLPEEYITVYTYSLKCGVLSLYSKIGGKQYEKSDRGFISRKANDLQLTEAEYASIRNTAELNENVVEENLYFLNKIIELCKENDIRLIMVTLPISRRLICSYSNCDEVFGVYEDIAEQNDIEYFNFNLLRDKYERFPEQTAFYDIMHLSDEGAYNFTELMTDVIIRSGNHEDVSDLFYSSFDEFYEAMGEN